MKKIIKSGPMKLVSNKKALSSGFITSKIIRRTATDPYLFIHGRQFMGLEICFAGQAAERQQRLEVFDGFGFWQVIGGRFPYEA
jgi:hypothetical protein